MDTTTLFYRFGVALAIGFLVGLQREYAKGGGAGKEMFAGEQVLGAVADVVGGKLRQLGRTCQVLCITHLPQIAAHGDAHFRIDKPLKGDRAVTTVKRVDGEARDLELARMIGGAAITESVLASARQMRDKQGARSEHKAKRVPEGRSRPPRVGNR